MNSVCYYFVTTDRDRDASETFKIVMNYAFAADVYLFNGDSILSATNSTYARSGVTYTYLSTSSGEDVNIWILIVPEKQYYYDY
mmetsp:Transcript_33839/g.24870  ORF Transcript_33839/g.24870 Transcript_33839/m.24870 type:complete len:84 (-) Transcript_33839:222-473(-)